MIAKIRRSTNLYGALAYNQLKEEHENGQILFTNKMIETTSGHYSVAQLAHLLPLTSLLTAILRNIHYIFRSIPTRKIPLTMINTEKWQSTICVRWATANSLLWSLNIPILTVAIFILFRFAWMSRVKRFQTNSKKCGL